jgi:hypothetical protein
MLFGTRNPKLYFFHFRAVKICSGLEILYAAPFHFRVVQAIGAGAFTSGLENPKLWFSCSITELSPIRNGVGGLSVSETSKTLLLQ